MAFVTRVVLTMVTSMAERSNQPRSNNKGDRPRLGDIRIELTLPREVYNRLLVLESMSGMSRTRVAASFIAQAVKDPVVAAGSSGCEKLERSNDRFASQGPFSIPDVAALARLAFAVFDPACLRIRR
jgi:hypothetical protein